MANQAELLPGTLDLLILKALSLGALHGCGVLRRIGQISGGGLTIEQGSLYPALYRLKAQGVLDSEWGTSVNKRRAKFYRLLDLLILKALSLGALHGCGVLRRIGQISGGGLTIEQGSLVS